MSEQEGDVPQPGSRSGGVVSSMQGTSVLVVDDEIDLTTIIQSALIDMGAKARVANDGYSALQILMFHDIDVVMVDIRMPVMSGFEFIAEARRICPWLSFIILSGYVGESATQQAADLGITEIMEKPFNLRDLSEMLARQAIKKSERLERPATLSVERKQTEQNVLQRITFAAVHSDTLSEALFELCTAIGEVLPISVAGMLELGKSPKLDLQLIEAVSPSFIQEVEKDVRYRHQLLSNGKKLPKAIETEHHGCQTAEDGPSHARTAHTLPVIVGGELSGFLCFATHQEDAYSDSDISFLYHITNHLSAVMADFSRTKRQATRDGLTGLFNRHYFMEQLEHFERLSKRYEYPVGIVILDLDDLKVANDTYGHITGDDILKELAEILMQTSRSSDVVARYGGDEFVVLLPETELAEVERFCSRVLVRVNRHVFAKGTADTRVTVSIGAAGMRTSDGHVLTPREFLAHADRALYKVKSAGLGGMRIWSDRDTDRRGQKEPPSGVDRTAAVASEAVMNALVRVLEAREHVDGPHWSRVKDMAVVLGRKMGLPRETLRDLAKGAILHDIGKIALPDEILNKETALNEKEWRVMRTHPEAGYRILQPLPFLSGPANIVRHHQERYDGSGYPLGLKGKEICIGARIVGVIDAYDAMRSNRPYRAELTIDAAIEELKEKVGTQFDPEVVEAFLVCAAEIEDLRCT